MNDLVGVKDVILDRSADELIGALSIALVLALSVTALASIGRDGRRKLHMPLAGLVFVANLMAMAIAAAYAVKQTPWERALAGASAVGPGASQRQMPYPHPGGPPHHGGPLGPMHGPPPPPPAKAPVT
jgi:hypothetical protein